MNCKLTVVTIFVLAPVLAAPAADARDIYFDIRGGFYFDAEEAMMGAGVLVPIIPDTPRWYFNPNFELAPGGVVDIFSANIDFHYDFTSTTDVTVWAGGGPGLYIYDLDHSHFDDTNTEVALNVLFGVGSKVGEIRPFVQAKGAFMDNSEAAIAVGIRF